MDKIELGRQKDAYESIFHTLSNDYHVTGIEDILIEYNELVDVHLRNSTEEMRMRELYQRIHSWNNLRVAPVYDEYCKLTKAGVVGIENPDRYRLRPM